MAQETPQHLHSHPRGLTFSGSGRPRPSLPFRQRTGTLPPGADLRMMPQEVPNPSHRHGTPSGPWPFLDLHVSINPRDILEPDTSKRCPHREQHDDEHCWCGYPQSLYPNWTIIQQRASRIREALRDSQKWTLYPLVVSKKGIFKILEDNPGQCGTVANFWESFRLPEKEAKDCHVHALFVDRMTGPIMQMLGTKYNIEPFFFSSSFGWIPSRYQESVVSGESDHITITLTFIRCISDPFNTSHEPVDGESIKSEGKNDSQRNIAIKTNEYLWLESSEQILFSDIISLHMIRHPVTGHTIISYHAPRKFRATTAKQLRDRFCLTGRSVYWSHIFARSNDPTFTFLSLLWYALYAWDESLEALYNHICALEFNVLEENDLDFTQELHRIRAHLLHYTSLLEDFKKTVLFVKDTHYPALDNEKYFTPKERQDSIELMDQECTNLLNQIERLDLTRKMQDKRLTNVMHLGFSTVNIQDSKRMHKLTEAAVRDSAAMKQIAYLTMFFLPASFVATAFGMNVVEINDGSVPTLGHYFAAAFPLTAITIWIVVALQIQIEDKPSRRSRARIPKKSRRSTDGKPYIDAPPGHELRKAYTAADGELIVGAPEIGYEGGYLPSDYHEDDEDEDQNDIHNENSHRNNNFQNSSLWKRLGWPVSLAKSTFTSWRKSREKNKKQRRNTPEPEKASVQRDKNLVHSLPTHFVGRDRNRTTMTPAARYAADIRSNHSGSTKSSSRSAPPLKPILKGKEKAVVTSSPVIPGVEFNPVTHTQAKAEEPPDLEMSSFDSSPASINASTVAPTSRSPS